MAGIWLCGALAAVVLVDGHRIAARHPHKAVGLERRLEIVPIKGPPPDLSIAATTTGSVLSVITPSPGASPVSVTKQSQLVTSYVPQYTLCELPPVAFSPITPAPSARPSTAPYHNYSISIPPGNGTCSTIYSATQTMVCATTLSDLTTTYPVTNCAQEITFSSQYGYTLVTPTPTPFANSSFSNATYPFANSTFYPFTNRTNNATATITPMPTLETKTTYYVAPWQSLTAATAPKNIVQEICSTVPAPLEVGIVNECVTEYYIWHTSLVTHMTTTTSSLNISTVIPGPSGVVIWDQVVANFTEAMTTLEMTTTLEKEFETHFTTTHEVSASYSTGPTVSQTMTVVLATPTGSATDDGTTTTTIHITSTTYLGTRTVTLPSPTPTV